MADFFEVHGAAIAAAFHETPSAHYRRIPVREIVQFQPPEALPVADVCHVVTFKNPGNRVEPATPADLEIIADWNKRHARTPLSMFTVPAFKGD